jgi:hypothetical protein
MKIWKIVGPLGTPAAILSSTILTRPQSHLKADTVGRMVITDKADFHTKVRASMRQLQNDAEKIRSFYQKPSLKYAA